MSRYLNNVNYIEQKDQTIENSQKCVSLYRINHSIKPMYIVYTIPKLSKHAIFQSRFIWLRYRVVPESKAY